MKRAGLKVKVNSFFLSLGIEGIVGFLVFLFVFFPVDGYILLSYSCGSFYYEFFPHICTVINQSLKN